MAKTGQGRKKVVEPDIVKIVNDTIVPKLRELGFTRDCDAETLRDHYRNRAAVPFSYQEDVDAQTIAKFSKHLPELPGVKIAAKPVRRYVYGALAAHLLGYVGDPLDIRQLPDLSKYTLYQPDAEGKSQIEYSMDEYLRGDAGARVLRKNERDMAEKEERVDPPKPGDNVFLTIDARIQYIVEQALRHPQIGRAAAVVVDPNNGEILAMASVPSFDPDALVTGGSTEVLRNLRADSALPLSSRAVSAFPPASTFELVTSLSGLCKESKKKDMANARCNCSGGIAYGDSYFKCWIAGKMTHGTHGTIGLADAIKVSCDCFFYQYANASGIEAITRVGKFTGIGEHFALGLQDENEGIMPGPDWMKSHYPELRWTSAHTANTAIGQGYVLATPLQMAMAYAAVANGGICYGPRLIKQVLTPEGKPVLDEKGEAAVPDRATIRGDLSAEVTKEQFDVVRRGLWLVVNDEGGTGARARVAGLTVAGKTGSTQAMEDKRNTEEAIPGSAASRHSKSRVTRSAPW